MVERFKIWAHDCGPEITSDPKGPWVSHYDYATLSARVAEVERERDEAVARIEEVCREEGLNGAACGWRSCTGCHESNEGVPQGPYSRTFKTHVGIGCCECGGLGVVWEYWSKDTLDTMQADISAESRASALEAELERLRAALRKIDALDEAMGHDLRERHAFEAVNIARAALAKEGE